MSTLFISDLHLQPAQPELLRTCLSWLKSTARAAEALYILGDLFEAWIGDDDDAEWIVELSSALRQLSDSGTQLYFIHGNRDFLLGAEFAQRCGITLLPELITIDLYGRPTLLLHGDTLCTQDTAYLTFREQVRNPIWQQMFLSQPADARRMFASAARSESKTANANKAEYIMDVTPSEVIAAMTAANVDLMIHGHTHRPARHQLIIGEQPAERIVLGDWGQDNSGWYIRAERNGAIELIKFPLAD